MKKQAKYIVSNSLTIQPLHNKCFVARNSFSNEPMSISQHIFFMLFLFLEPKTKESCFLEFKEKYEISKKDFFQVLSKLIKLGYILRINDTAGPSDSKISHGFGNVKNHYIMLKDTVRVMGYKQAISKSVKNKTVLEIGSGTGILSMFAAKSGAKKVFSIEETNIYDVSKKIIARNNLSGKIHLIRGNSKNVTLKGKADVLIHEIIGNDPIGENIITYLADARKRLLKPGGILIPFRLEVCVVGYCKMNRERIKEEMNYLGNLYDLDLADYSEAYSEKKDNNSLIEVLKENFYQYKSEYILSEEAVAFDFNLYEISDANSLKNNITLKIIKPGFLSGVILFFRAHLDENIVLSNSPNAPSTHWRPIFFVLSDEIQVKASTKIKLQVSVQTVLGKHKTVIKLID